MNIADQVKKYYYYYRDDEGKPYVTVCIMKFGEYYARGLSICSLNDNPVKEEGRKQARKRAYHALFNMINTEEISRNNAYSVLEHTRSQVFHFKSEYNPILTSHEKRIIGKELSIEI